MTGGSAEDNLLSVELIRKDGSTCTMPDMHSPGINIEIDYTGLTLPQIYSDIF